MLFLNKNYVYMQNYKGNRITPLSFPALNLRDVESLSSLLWSKSESSSVERVACLLISRSNDSVPAATRYIVPAARAARSAVRCYIIQFN